MDRLFISSDNNYGTHLLIANDDKDSLWVREIPMYFINKDQIPDPEEVTREDLNHIRFIVKTPDGLLDIICDILGANKTNVMSPCKEGGLVRARAYFYVIGYELKFYVYDLGRVVNRDRNTVSFHIRKYMGFLNEANPWYSKETKDAIHGIKLELKARLNEER